MKFTLTIEHKHGLIEELHLRAWQERAVKDIGRTTKAYRAGCEHATVALENLARDIGKWEVSNELEAEPDTEPCEIPENNPNSNGDCANCGYKLSAHSAPAHNV